MNANEMFRIEDTILVLQEQRDQVSTDRCGWPLWEAGGESWLTDRLSAYLACSINYLSRKVLPTMFDDLAESVFDGGIVAIYEVAVDELHRERGFSWGGWAIRLDRYA